MFRWCSKYWGLERCPQKCFKSTFFILVRNGTFAVRFPLSWALQKLSKTWPFSHYSSKSPLPLKKNLLIAFGSFGSLVVQNRQPVGCRGLLMKSISLLKQRQLLDHTQSKFCSIQYRICIIFIQQQKPRNSFFLIKGGSFLLNSGSAHLSCAP